MSFGISINIATEEQKGQGKADLPYDRSAEVILSWGQKQGDKSSPLLFGLVFNALLLALKATVATGVGHRNITRLLAPARGFADDLALVSVTRSEAAGNQRSWSKRLARYPKVLGSIPDLAPTHITCLLCSPLAISNEAMSFLFFEADMARLLQVVSRFCKWSGMRINVSKSVATGFDFAMGRDLPTDGIQYEGSPLPGLKRLSLAIKAPTKTKAQQKQHDIQDKVGKSLNNPEVKDLVGVRTKKQAKEILESDRKTRSQTRSTINLRSRTK